MNQIPQTIHIDRHPHRIYAVTGIDVTSTVHDAIVTVIVENTCDCCDDGVYMDRWPAVYDGETDTHSFTDVDEHHDVTGFGLTVY